MINDQKPYTIIMATDLIFLQALVIRAIRKSYVPTGGPFRVDDVRVQEVPSGMPGWGQAMIRITVLPGGHL